MDSKLELENERLRARVEELEAGDGQRRAVSSQRVESEDVE
jgi:hypothetical protein